jgi:hypothetical protein
MALTPGEGDGGTGGVLGGTASSICAISPSDLVGTLGNLITRIEQLEFQLSQIVGANLHTEQLSNISEQVGWVYGVEYMGIPGWTQTEYGTLIPPAGFTMTGSGIQLYNSCTGEFEDYQAVVMDENGVLQWGATAAGNLCGAKVEDWNDAAAAAEPADYAVTKRDGGAGTTYNSSRGIVITTSAPSSMEGTAIFTVAQAGIYLVSAFYQPATLSAGASWTFSISFPDANQSVTVLGGATTGTSSVNSWQRTTIANLAAGNQIIAGFDLASGSSGTPNKFELSAYRIAPAS